MNFASELVGLITRKDTATSRHASQKIENPFSRMLPTHIITALVIKEKMASPPDYDPTLLECWSEQPKDKAFGAKCNTFSSKFTGFSICHPIYHGNTLYLTTRNAIYSAALSTEATANFMILPSWNKRMTTNPYASLYRRFPHMCKCLGVIPSDQLQYAEVPFRNNIQTPLPKHTWDMHIISIWNTKDRNCLNACNKNWLKQLAKENPEAEWEINYIYNNPYPFALSTEKTPKLNKVSKLSSDHLCQAPQGPQDKNSTLDPSQSSDEANQHSSSSNLIRKVQGWRDWNYTDGKS